MERGRPQMAIWRMRVACWIPKAIDTHSEYLILRFVENSGYANALRCDVYTHIVCLVALKVVVRTVWVLNICGSVHHA